MSSVCIENVRVKGIRYRVQCMLFHLELLLHTGNIRAGRGEASYSRRPTGMNLTLGYQLPIK